MDSVKKIKSLVSFGFKEYKTNNFDKHDRVFSYCLSDKIGKKFYISVRFWEMSKYSDANRTIDDAFDAICQFDVNGKRTFDVTTKVTDMSPQQIVDWFNNVFISLKCEYYELYEEVLLHCKKCDSFIGANNITGFCDRCQYILDSGFLK